MQNYTRVLLYCLLLSIPGVAIAQSPTIAFVGDVRVDSKTKSVPSLQVQGIVGDSIFISYAPESPDLTDCQVSFSTMTPLELDSAGSFSLALASNTKTFSVSSIYPGDSASNKNPLTQGVQLCIRADRLVDKNTQSAFSRAPLKVAEALPDAVLSIAKTPVYGDSSLSVQASFPADTLPVDVFVYDMQVPAIGKDVPSCDPANLTGATSLTLGAAAETSQMLTDSSTVSLSLSKPLTAGDQVCLIATSRKNATVAHSELIRVVAPDTGRITFLSDLVGGLSTVNFVSSTSGFVSIFLFGAGYSHLLDSPCGPADREYGELLNAVGNGTNATISSIHVDANVPEVVSLTQPLLAGSQVCIYESTSDSNAPSLFSKFKPVNYFAPGEDYGRFSLGFVGGAVISNQEQSSNSSTASQYLEVAFNYAIMRGIFQIDGRCPPYRTKCGRHGGPGLQAFMDVRSSTIPVTSIDNQSQAHASGNVDITQSLNALSSQQSVRIVTGIYAPFRLTRWYRSTNWLTLGPLAVGGFDTLLNPTAPQAPPSTGSVINTTTSNFSSVYGYFAAGGEINWKVYAASTDEAPRDMGWVSATLGHYSNLPSYICTADSKRAPSAKSYFFNDAANPPTDCLVNTIVTKDANEVVTSTSYNVFASRKLIPRLDIAGQLALPTLPVVLGMDANLGQYLIGGNKHEHLDTLNKAGNDVRIFIGIRLDPGQLLSKIGVSTGSGK